MRAQRTAMRENELREEKKARVPSAFLTHLLTVELGRAERGDSKAGVCVVFHGQPCNAPRSYSSRLGFPHSGFVLEGEHQPFHMSERIAAQSDKLLMKNVTIFALYSGKKIEVELIQRFQR